MHLNWTVIIIVGVAALALVIFLTVRNVKDEKKFEKDMNQDYPKKTGESDETEAGGVGK